jgi:hypothetical protein
MRATDPTSFIAIVLLVSNVFPLKQNKGLRFFVDKNSVDIVIIAKIVVNQQFFLAFYWAGAQEMIAPLIRESGD